LPRGKKGQFAGVVVVVVVVVVVAAAAARSDNLPMGGEGNGMTLLTQTQLLFVMEAISNSSNLILWDMPALLP
jgi:hypothetical protein